MKNLKETWKEAVVAYFKVLSWHSLEGAEEIHEKNCQNNHCHG
jgi:hypothetical protein